MKRTRVEANLPQHKSKCNLEINLEQELNDDSLFLDTLYQGNSNNIEENEELVAMKIQEAEEEMETLLPTSRFKEAYFCAIAQEIQQQLCYVRSKELLLAFLRTEGFNVRKAVLRLGLFLQYKLSLFGPEILPRQIKQEHLTHEDKKLLCSGAMSVCGVDTGGRLLFFLHLNQARSMGFLHQKYAASMARLIMYLFMFEMKYNDHWDQSKGVVLIRYGLNVTLPLKHARIIMSNLIKLIGWAMPISIMAIHAFANNAIERSCFQFSKMLAPKSTLSKIQLHAASSPAACLSVLSNYGIDVNDLPITITGDIRAAFHSNKVKELRQKELYLPALTLLEEKYNNNNNNNNSTIVCNHATMNNSSTKMDQLNQRHKQLFSNHHQAAVSLDLTSKAEAKECFPSQLMTVLLSESNPDAIWWSRDGTAFVIEKHKFVSNVLPKKFSGIKYNSFLRRLRRWNFQRISQKVGAGLNCIEYQHRCFQRNSPHLIEDWEDDNEEKFPCKLMKIINNNGSSSSIWWILDGQAFAINMNKFSSDVLSKEFKGVQKSSFLRLMRKWGFKTLLDVNESKTENHNNILFFQHTLFQKNSNLSQIDFENWTTFNRDDNDSIKAETFPKKLYQILGSEKYKHAIWWQSDKNAFAIDEVEFSRNVLLLEFGGIKFDSFKRNLQRWRFKKVGNDAVNPNISIFSNPLFLKDSPDLLDSFTELKESEGTPDNFPKKLYRILNSERTQNAIWWLDCGCAFAIREDKFASDILPEEYGDIKLGSFKRSLQRWGFRKKDKVVSSYPNVSFFYHPLFLRDSPELLENWRKIEN